VGDVVRGAQARAGVGAAKSVEDGVVDEDLVAGTGTKPAL
jgi:hypothetical protein